MANNQGKNNLWSDDMETFKVRMFTNIPPNAVLVGHNIFTKSKKVYSKAMFHMPWLRSRFISLETKNLDLNSEKVEIGDKGLEAVADFGISYKVTGVEKSNKLTIKQRWMSIFSGFSTSPIASTLKALALGATAVGATVLLGPLGLLGVAGATATYGSFFHQNEEWTERHGAITSAYNNASAMSELEQIVYNALRVYYATHSYEQVKGKTLDIQNDPDLMQLRDELEEFNRDYGVKVTRITNKKLDLTDESNELLRQQRQNEIELERAKKLDEAQKINQATRMQHIQQLVAQGFSLDQIASMIETDALTKGGANVIVSRGGGAPVPAISVPPVHSDEESTKTR